MKNRSIKFKILNNRRKGVSIIILIFSILAICSLAALVIDLGIILNCRYELQKAVETSALAAISEYEAYEDNAHLIKYPPIANISTNANSVVNNNLQAFENSNSLLLISRNITPTITFGGTIQSRYSRAIRVDVTAVVRTYFLSLVGIRSIELQASAAAMHVPVYLHNGNILNGVNAGSGPYQDTDLRAPVDGSIGGGVPDIVNVNTNFNNIYGIPDGKAVSLGPGGYITIKLPATLVDGKGFDLQIITAGDAKGYYVYAGNDIDPSNPYIDAANPGGGIQWENISCIGTPIGTTTNGVVGSYYNNGGGGIGSDQIFYGSGYFDLGAQCTNNLGVSTYNGNVRTAKYLKIIDDNVEDGFSLKDPENDSDFAAKPSLFPGQNSSFTPGVSIDAVAVEHHPRLISLTDFTTDTDNDGLIDAFEDSLGLNRCGPSDGTHNCITPPASDDALEFWGFDSTGITNIIQDQAAGTSTLRIDYPTRSDNPPKIFINF